MSRHITSTTASSSNFCFTLCYRTLSSSLSTLFDAKHFTKCSRRTITSAASPWALSSGYLELGMFPSLYLRHFLFLLWWHNLRLRTSDANSRLFSYARMSLMILILTYSDILFCFSLKLSLRTSLDHELTSPKNIGQDSNFSTSGMLWFCDQWLHRTINCVSFSTGPVNVTYTYGLRVVNLSRPS